MDDSRVGTGATLDAGGVAAYRRDGYVVLRRLLSPAHIEACCKALADLATGAIPRRETLLMFETGIDGTKLAPHEREGAIRKYMDFCPEAPALMAAAMHRDLHAALDRILGEGRVLFQEMALIKPPRVGSDKPWHQDASYFRVTDPGLVVGVWIALDPALKANGCMEVVPGSHLGGGVPHVHENDFNRCRIVERRQRAAEALAVEMQPGDALVFHSLLHHFTARNLSDLRRRAVQFHYHQLGAVWGDVEQHRRHFQDESGAYAGCTVPHEPLQPGQQRYQYRGPSFSRPVVPTDWPG